LIIPVNSNPASPSTARAGLSKTGNAACAHALYMPAIVARKHNPIIREFSQRLQITGCVRCSSGCRHAQLHVLAYGVIKTDMPLTQFYSWGLTSKTYLHIDEIRRFPTPPTWV
jgi:hypothetical protein